MNDINDKLLEMKAEVFHAIGHPVRLKIVELLGPGELCVCDIAEQIGVERSNCSKHLSVMLRAGILDVRKDGLKMIYSLKAPCIATFMSCVESLLLSRLSEKMEMIEQLQSKGSSIQRAE